MGEKRYHIGDVLSVTTGRVVSPRHVDGLVDILQFMTGERLYSHQLPRAIENCKPHLVTQYPWLDSPMINVMAVGELILLLDTAPGKEEPEKLTLGWLSKLASGRYGVQCEGVDSDMMLSVLPLGSSVAEDPP
jgi:hypothetical protein